MKKIILNDENAIGKLWFIPDGEFVEAVAGGVFAICVVGYYRTAVEGGDSSLREADPFGAVEGPGRVGERSVGFCSSGEECHGGTGPFVLKGHEVGCSAAREIGGSFGRVEIACGILGEHCLVAFGGQADNCTYVCTDQR